MATTSEKLSSTTTFYAEPITTPPPKCHFDPDWNTQKPRQSYILIVSSNASISISPNEESLRASSIISEALSSWSECELEGIRKSDALDACFGFGDTPKWFGFGFIANEWYDLKVISYGESTFKSSEERRAWTSIKTSWPWDTPGVTQTSADRPLRSGTNGTRYNVVSPPKGRTSFPFLVLWVTDKDTTPYLPLVANNGGWSLCSATPWRWRWQLWSKRKGMCGYDAFPGLRRGCVLRWRGRVEGWGWVGRREEGKGGGDGEQGDGSGVRQ